MMFVVGCGSNEQRGYAPPPQAAQNSQTMSRYSGKFDASLRAAGPSPTVGKPWRWSVKATTKDGRPLATRTKVQFMLGGRVVGRGGQRSFVGSTKASVRWPDRSAGFPLVFRVVVDTDEGSANLDYPVQVRRP